MLTIFDIGMYDGTDTEYYLSLGGRVVSVDANPLFVQRGQQRFSAEIAAGRLTIVHAAMSSDHAPVELTLSGDDLGASSMFGDRVVDRQPMGTITAPGLPVRDLMEQYGVPDYLKVDIEGADRFCILNLNREMRPRYMSFEVAPDVEELLEHIRSIGYARFKIINQVSFRELANEANLRDRLVLRAAECLGVGKPQMIRRAGRFFAAGSCSGPVPWKSDGRWYSGDETVARWRSARARGDAKAHYDIHAALD
ncbi:MAG TPA: FkbM family methyltransferase [Candidatus Krumholzibacteria bacterium]|nr:FkbM family methyltransferase [Candidatus Krumholzibacteria bacterium]